MNKKLLLISLITISACNKKNEYHFRYEGEKALISCNDSKYEQFMCEQDGQTFANGIWARNINNNTETIYSFYINGKIKGHDSFIKTGDVRSIVNDTDNIATYIYCKDNKLCNIACKNSEKNQKDINISGENLQKALNNTNGKITCEYIIKNKK